MDVYGFDVWQKYATNKQNANLNRAPEEAMAKLYEVPLEDENYQYSNSLSNMMNYDIQGYDIDPETGIAGLVILRGRTDTYYYGKVLESVIPMTYRAAAYIEIHLYTSEYWVSDCYYDDITLVEY